MTLVELTRQESGIIVFPLESNVFQDRHTVGVYNWARCGNEELPIVFYGDYIGLPWKADHQLLEQAKGSGQCVDDVRDALPGTVWLKEREGESIIFDSDMNIVYDYNSDLPLLFLGEDGNGPKQKTPGVVYTLGDGTIIIAPTGWA